ncbi:MAG: phage virion morphogenesis protein [Chitinispirillaceae bacterium]|nr:phage virion morphogenesis protein [Chitinispirillaceae bacterium]
MAGALIDIHIDDAGFQGAIHAITSRATDLSAPMKVTGEIVVKSVRENFLQQGRPTTWKPLSSATRFGIIGGSRGFKKSGDMKRGARRKLVDRKILIDRGMAGGLMGSIHYQASPTSVFVGTEKPYGAIHQFGGMAGRNKKVRIPQREFLLLQDEDKPVIIDVFKRHVLPKGV